jgi:hypothetical protein
VSSVNRAALAPSEHAALLYRVPHRHRQQPVIHQACTGVAVVDQLDLIGAQLVIGYPGSGEQMQ